MERYSVKKRIALDGRPWWCIWDNKTGNWSTCVFHGKYKTRKDAQYYLAWSIRTMKGA